MPFISLFFIFFGAVILAFPDFLAYIIGFLFLFIGINSFLMSLAFRKKKENDQTSWSFGKYEILRKK